MKILTPLIFKITCLLIAAICIFSACRKDEHDISPDEFNSRTSTIKLHPPNPDWSDKEQRFFSLARAGGDNTMANTRNGDNEFPDFLISTFNKILTDNDPHDFVIGVVGRIGYPEWQHALVREIENGSFNFIMIPFTKPENSRTEAILMGIKDNTASEISFHVRLRKDMEDAIIQELSDIPNMYSDAIHFMGYDSLLYNQVSDEMFNYWVAHYVGEDGYPANPRCQTTEMGLCYEVGVSGPTPIGGNGGGGVLFP